MLIAQPQQFAVDELRRADIQPARRLRRDQYFGRFGQFARDHDFLRVAAGERAQAHIRPAHANIELLDGALRKRRIRPGFSTPQTRKRRGVIARRDDILIQCGRQTQPLVRAVFGDERHSGGAALAVAGLRDQRPVIERDVALRRRAQPDQRLDQFALAVALDARQPDDLARVDGERSSRARRAARDHPWRADRARSARGWLAG